MEAGGWRLLLAVACIDLEGLDDKAFCHGFPHLSPPCARGGGRILARPLVPVVSMRLIAPHIFVAVLGLSADALTLHTQGALRACSGSRSPARVVPLATLVSRRSALAAALTTVATCQGAQADTVTAAPPSVAPAVNSAGPRVTDRVFIDVRVIQRFANPPNMPPLEVLEDAAVRGRMVFGLYGDDSPKGVERFLSFVTGNIGQFTDGQGPSYRSSLFDRLEPGRLVEGGRITGLKQVEFAGSLEYQYGNRMLPLRPVLEANNLKHDSRGLLTRRTFESGPQFSVTLSRNPALDGSNEVLGKLEEGDDLLQLIESQPYITGKSIDPPGSAKDKIFDVQKSIFGTLSKAAGDSRAEDRTGKLLRRVEITNVGIL